MKVSHSACHPALSPGIVALLLLLTTGYPCFSQNSLLFQKNKNKEVLYMPGDVISFRLKGDPAKHTFQIIGFEDSLIVMRNYKVNPAEITDMYVDSKTKNWYFLKYKWSKLLFIVGAGYLTLDWINSGELTKETLTFSAALITAGILTKWIIPTRIKIDGKKKLVIRR